MKKQPKMNFIFMSGDKNALRPNNNDRRFLAIDIESNHPLPQIAIASGHFKQHIKLLEKIESDLRKASLNPKIHLGLLNHD